MTHATSQVALVEDDQAVLTALERVVRAAGFDPVSYTSAEQFFASPPVRLPVCVVLDIRLGGMSGIELQRRLRAMGSSLAVIVLTAVDDSDIRDEAYRLGCAAFLPKDADAELLIGLIRTLERSTRPDVDVW